MAHRARRITDAIQTHDALLYAKDDKGVIRIYRKCKEYQPEQLTPGIAILNVIRNDHLVMSLTDTWGVRGTKADWGIEPIMARLRALDLWNSWNLAEQFFKDEEIDAKARARKMKNSTEDFLYDFKRSFQKSTNDIVVSNLSKRTNFKGV